MPTITEETRIALETERKFEFYIAGAIFTILALAVQSAEVLPELIQNVLMAISFLFLFASSICAVFALSIMMKRHWVIADVSGWNEGLQALKDVKNKGIKDVSQNGQQKPIDEVILDFESNKLKNEQASISRRKIIDWLRKGRQCLFLIGLLLLLLAKTWPILQQFRQAICKA
jgi:hypothetical protein